MLTSHAELIAQSAATAAWVGASASTFASLVALSVAVWGARREERSRARTVKDQQSAFAFGMVGAVEMIKPLVIEARAHPDGRVPRRRFVDAVDHALTIADAALSIQSFDMQMLRDGYLVRGALRGLRNLIEDEAGAGVLHTEINEVIAPVLASLLDADDRFFARLPAIGEIEGISGRTEMERPAA